MMKEKYKLKEWEEAALHLPWTIKWHWKRKILKLFYIVQQHSIGESYDRKCLGNNPYLFFSSLKELYFESISNPLNF